jgi:hypothetical protein
MELWLCCWGGRQALLAVWRRCTYLLDHPIDFHRFHHVPSKPCLYSSTSTATSPVVFKSGYGLQSLQFKIVTFHLALDPALVISYVQ